MNIAVGFKNIADEDFRALRPVILPVGWRCALIGRMESAQGFRRNPRRIVASETIIVVNCIIWGGHGLIEWNYYLALNRVNLFRAGAVMDGQRALAQPSGPLTRSCTRDFRGVR